MRVTDRHFDVIRKEIVTATRVASPGLGEDRSQPSVSKGAAVVGRGEAKSI
jgi:hypothetical protein